MTEQYWHYSESMENRKSSRSTSKRTYTQDADSDEDAKSQEASDDNESEEEGTQRNTRQPKRSRINPDDLFEDEDSDREEENVRPRNDTGTYAGQLRRIYLENFMCHRKLTVDFNSSLTFVGGVNGSGKSAIAVALMVCLGATAKSTGRGSSNARFIRQGWSGSAIIKVFLRNEGADAYRPDVYGKTIVVTRKIAVSGGGYDLQSEDGKVRDELVMNYRNCWIFLYR